ncbi:MAG TPA: 50S ribosomal protein L9 [Myxococcales bacterium]|nr:50S ribosomal protein L9 [Myxococcales bacterium]
MKVILREKVPNLGNIGDVVTVSDGYGRNYLLPRKLALLANDRNVKELDHQQRMMAKRLEDAKAGSMQIADRLKGQRVTVRKHAGEEGKLFGSVTARELVELLSDRGFVLDRRDLDLKEPIKQVGSYEIAVAIHVDVVTSFTVIVEAIAPEPDAEPVVAEATTDASTEEASASDEGIEYIEGYDMLTE